MGGKQVVQLAALTGLMTLAAGWLAAAPAGAATPTQVIHTQLNLSLPDQVVCGFTVDSVVQGTNTVQTFTDQSGNMSMQDTTSVVSTLINVANGKVVHVGASGRDSTPAPVVNPDGTLTFTDTLTGIDQRVYTSHSNTLVKDSGFLAIVSTFDSTGTVLLSQQVIEHGPHPFASDPTVFCDAIASAIGP